MSSPAGDPSSDMSGASAEASGASGGFEIDDPVLAESMSQGVAQVERILHDSLHSDLQFATRTSSHLVDAGGKRFRPLFALLAAKFGESVNPDVIKSAAIVELVHLATLYHDDVMDEATMRRGASSANARWDNSVAILTGDFLFAQASMLVADLGAEAVRSMAATFELLVTGQMRETVGAGGEDDPVEYYLRVIYEKTGSLIATAGRFGAWFSGAKSEHVEVLERIGGIIGAGFQISDDIIDIASPAGESGKTPGTDLREGVRTLPMLYALAEPSGDPRLHELLSGPLDADEDVGEALRRLRCSDGLAHARRTLDDYARQAREEIALLPDCAAREALSSLVDYVVARTR